MNKALFLDRDGVINVTTPGRYVNDLSDLHILEAAEVLVQDYRNAGYLPIVVTNQAGVAHGHLTEERLAQIHKWMCQLMADHGVPLHAVYAAIELDGPMRKPAPGMLLQAQREHDIDMEASVLIGDNITDIQAGAAAGVGRCILIPSNRIDLMPRLTNSDEDYWDSLF